VSGLWRLRECEPGRAVCTASAAGQSGDVPGERAACPVGVPLGRLPGMYELTEA
jgi:hypothetical protein